MPKNRDSVESGTLYDPNIDYLLLGHPSQRNIYLHAQVLTFVSKFKQPTLIPDARHRKDDPPYTEEIEILRGMVFFFNQTKKGREYCPNKKQGRNVVSFRAPLI